MRRRNFIKYAGAGLIVTGTNPAWAFRSLKPESKKLTILHTNDFHKIVMILIKFVRMSWSL